MEAEAEAMEAAKKSTASTSLFIVFVVILSFYQIAA